MQSQFIKFKPIPKVIWQTGEEEIHKLKEPFSKNVTTWKLMNPEHSHKYACNREKMSDIKEFDDKDFIELSEYVQGKYLADLWRYIMLYWHGGIYADLDSVCWAPVEIMQYFYTGSKTQTWVVPKDDEYGFKDMSEPHYINRGSQEICKECQTFKGLLGLGPSNHGKIWISNGAFATTQWAEPMKNVLEEVRYRFGLFKALHRDGFDSTHEGLNNIVDCTAFHTGIFKNEELVSQTFIGALQSFDNTEDNREGLMFKDYFDDYTVFSMKTMAFSDFKNF